ncbi:conserved hypothetical protein [uncultured delta proteobacterium]|uniref:DUF362 domain-containing protein n=1 Tax=uncultured delta proteobacterium TaxID=34034 RepID=A0A212JW41_9DELT|nr:conserved hypothetical protein [uncultured delta proteobacterium]
MTEPQLPPRYNVVLAKATAYDEEAVKTARTLLAFLDIPFAPGDRVLVKPNLLRADVLTCTNATIVAGVCRYLLDMGCNVMVGDSPGFGTARGVAKSIGLDVALARAGCGEVPLISLDSPVKKPLSLGGSIGLSRHALEADYIVNLPKLKAHVQMRVTGAVKNLFGCISGVRKAFAHTRHGDKETDGVQVFPSLIADILNHLPPVVTLMDGITAMHVRGPSGGKEFPARFLAASASPVALDTAVYSMLGVAPEDIPLWRELRRRNAPGAFLEQVALSGEDLCEFDLSGFMLPMNLMPQAFNPVRLVVSTVKRLWARSVSAGN